MISPKTHLGIQIKLTLVGPNLGWITWIQHVLMGKFKIGFCITSAAYARFISICLVSSRSGISCHFFRRFCHCTNTTLALTTVRNSKSPFADRRTAYKCSQNHSMLWTKYKSYFANQTLCCGHCFVLWSAQLSKTLHKSRILTETYLLFKNRTISSWL